MNSCVCACCVFALDVSPVANTVLTSNKVLHVMHSSDQEDVCYAMTGNGVCVTGDRGLSTILAQLNTFYTQRRSLSVEVSVKEHGGCVSLCM